MQSDQKFDVQLIVDQLSKILPTATPQSPIGLHEPDFSESKAWDYVKDCLDSGWVSSAGEWVSRFEEQICQVTNAKYAIAVTNGTVALRLALHLVGVRAGEEVIMPPISFIATANSAAHIGALPHFVDIEENTLGLSANSLSERLEKVAEKTSKGVFNINTKRRIAAIVPVHVFGMPANISDILKVSKKWGIPVVEDAAEALGSSQNQIHCGLHGDCGIISFNGNKLITTGGGGALITNNQHLANRARHLSTTAKIPHQWDFDHDDVGWNDRMPNLNAALGVAGLEQLSKKIKYKKILLNKYIDQFMNVDNCEIMTSPKHSASNNWLITLRLLNIDIKKSSQIRLEILKAAHSKGFLLRPVWKPLNTMRMYQNCEKGDLCNAENQSNRLISLPSSPKLAKEK